MPSWEYSSCQLRCIGSFFLTLCWLFAQISSFEKLVWDNSLDLTWIWYVNFFTAGQFFQQVYLFLDKLGRWVGCCQLWVDWLLFTRSFLPMYELNNSKGIEITHWNYILVMHVNRLGITSHWFPKKYVTVETAWKCYKRCWLLAFLLLIQWLWIKITHWNYILVMHVNR